LPLFYGRAGLPIPRPVRLWHLLSEPIVPPVAGPDVRAADVEAHHRAVVARMERLMAEALELKGG
jgi:hypothetical protein